MTSGKDEKQQSPLRILSLEVENILRVVAVRLQPNGQVLELTGKNRAGKSSVIDALWIALGGKIPPDPIHDGAEMGQVLVEIGDDTGLKYSVQKRIKQKENGEIAPSLIIENADGAKISNAQTILNALIGSLSCDPLDFIAMKPKDQFDLLKRFVPGVDFEAIEKANADDFSIRTDVNRDIKNRRAQLDAIKVDEASEQIDVDALLEELTKAADHNAAIERQKLEIQTNENRAIETLRRAQQLVDEAQDLRRRADDLDQNAATLRDEATQLAESVNSAPDLPDPIDPTALRTKINEARAHNTRVQENERAIAQRSRLEADLKILEEQSSALTAAIESRKAAKEKAISEAEMPVPGISFGDGIILYEGHPLQNASQAQKLQIAIAVAEAMQPRLRFITTKNAALLDDESWAAMTKLAEEKDLLIIAETVNSSRPTAVVIEDGHVRGQKLAAK
ncbi:AAA family ATPase [Rhodopseudomonas sp. BR0C11]|uniref:ATP-binding protein n=1 Tax=Rhodopseudomonas sp. BR0C11 TaxID=2269370 RepID=UPI0013DEDB3F|nr:AAA family ATPase [Rhodopseudomonas sp. BR0C11]NEV75523.1 AAA family ATPase [Rhodopseudomonas sp. BR0C11]